jgi:hypothetical protein
MSPKSYRHEQCVALSLVINKKWNYREPQDRTFGMKHDPASAEISTPISARSKNAGIEK